MAVAAELKRQQPGVHLVYVGQTGDHLADIPAADPNIDEVFSVRAGKFRRYHGEGLKQLLDLPTWFKNIRDGFLVLIGIWQSWRLAGRLKPDIVFSRGGFVSVPVSLGAHLRGVPYITHDSDPVPSLANRLIARWASLHAVALPKELYAYPANKTVTTGIPLNKEFVPVNDKLSRKYRGEIDVPAKARLLFVIGGGLGAQRVNAAVAEAVPHLLKEFEDLYVVHGAGRANQADMAAFYEANLAPAEQGRVRVHGYLTDVYRYSGAADVVITRAGATNLAEFAVQGKACIVVPSPFLTGGHQLKNAEYLADQSAALVLTEDDLAADPNRLAKQVSQLLSDPDRRQELGKRLADFAVPNASQVIADLIIKQAGAGR
jgi:UDP-N-acetylglucosamine--N-acetylmuramyl-(pentapeptide) pyrophosphoryl-undecaprenol N-acetylglucosamine transferase